MSTVNLHVRDVNIGDTSCVGPNAEPCITSNNGSDNASSTSKLIKECNNILNDFIERANCVNRENIKEREDCLERLKIERDRLKREYDSAKEGLQLIAEQKYLNDDETFKKIKEEFDGLEKRFQATSCDMCSDCSCLCRKPTLRYYKEIEKSLKGVKLDEMNRLLINKNKLDAVDKINELGYEEDCKSKLFCFLLFALGVFLVVFTCSMFCVGSLESMSSFICSIILLFGFGMIIYSVWHWHQDKKRRAEFEKKKNEEKLRIISRLTY